MDETGYTGRIANWVEQVSAMRASIFKITAMLAALLGVALSPAFAQEREWNFDTGDDDAYLVFGVPETDDVGVSFWCTIGTGEIRLFLPEAGDNLAAGKPVKIEVDAAGHQFSFDGKTAPNEEAATTSGEARIDAASPMFQALLTADRFAVRIGKEDSVFPLQGADFESLLRVCARR
jgi:hypothetical protein